MISFLNLVLIGIALIGASHGASVASKAPSTNCSISDGYFASSCFMRMRDFAEKILELDVNDKEELKEFKKSCDILGNCFNNICEGFSDDKIKRVSVMVKTYCGVVNYMVDNFKTCADKLDTKNSKCFDDWDPFPTEKELEDEKTTEEACKNFFGKDQCMKKEITEACGQKDWEGFRDHFIKLDEDIMKQCSLRKIFT